MTVGTETEAHAAAVDTLRASYAAIPPGQPVRLSKRTSNLFRPRAQAPTPGLDVSGLSDVLAVDPESGTADVQGMCTYERLVDATLLHGLMPLVVPQLKTITLGGAVSGLGIESSSFRSGLPHESVLEMDIVTGDGEIVTATPDGPHADLFEAFPNSYGSLGYAVRLRIELEQTRRYVGLRHLPYADLDELTDVVGQICAEGAWLGEDVDFLDGVMFGPAEAYLTLGRWSDDVPRPGPSAPSDYTGQQIYYRSIRERSHDLLTARDYLWRWDTDWFWCSRTFGAQHPVARRLWPARYRRSDVYHRIVGWENRYQVMARIDRRRGKPDRERVVQDVEIPLERTADFLRWFHTHVGMSPAWLCPLQLREPTGPGSATRWPLYPLSPRQVYVNVGFWGMVPIRPGRADGDVNKLIEVAVADHGGHKSLYSDSYYDEATFAEMYGGPTYRAVKDAYDPGHRLTDLYDKAVGR
ncbi:MAG: FAD-binding oxidoreductase [Nocardioidaceae bacterium]|nr:FAD-binding oxidoreductase [Nocardioidaceae bacterium]